MRNLLLSLLVSLLALPVYGQVTITGMTLEDVTITAAAATSAAPDWSSYFAAVWDFESSGTPGASTGGDSGSCNLSTFGGSRETGAGAFVNGVAGSLFEDNTDQGEVGTTTCSNIAADVDASSMSWGGWVMPIYDGSGTDLPQFMGTTGNGYYLKDSSASLARCAYYQETSLSYSLTDSAGNIMPDDAWAHVVCVWDDASDEMRIYGAGVLDETEASLTESMDSEGATGFKLADTLHTKSQRLDDAWVYVGVLSAAEIARVGACGVDGADCTCNGTAWVDKGKVDTSCSGSGSPWACCTGSGTGCVDADALTDDCNKANP